MTGPAARLGLRGDPAGRVEARQAAERLQGQYPGAEVRPYRGRDCDGLEAIVGGQRRSGTVAEVEKWLRRQQAPAGEDGPGSPAPSPAGQEG